MKRYRVRRSVGVIVAVLAMPGMALTQVDLDTSRTYPQRPVTIHAASLVARSTASKGTLTRIEGWAVRRWDGRSIEAVLEDEGGLFVRDIGGSSGVKTVTLRNLPATQTIVQLNGLRLNQAQNGLADLGLYPTALFDVVDVVRGGQTSLFGPDASAGAVVLGVRPALEDRASASAAWGSFGEQGVNVRWDKAFRRAYLGIRAGADRDDGDFPYRWSDSSSVQTRRREGAEHRREYGALAMVLPMKDHAMLEATLLGIDSRRGSPGPVTNGATYRATLKDRVVHGIVRWSREDPDRSAWEGGLAATWHRQSYEQADVPGPSSDTYDGRSVSTWWQSLVPLRPTMNVGVGLEGSYAMVRSPNLTDPRRTAGAVTSFGEWTVTDDGLTIQPMVRFDAASDHAPYLSPRLALQWPVAFLASCVARASVGSSIRTPSFNELYWNPGGNPLLRPERIVSADAGMRWTQPTEEGTSVTLNVFVADVRDRITGWPPVNIARTLTFGADGRLEIRASGHRWWLNATAAMVESVEPAWSGRQAPYAPRYVATAGSDLFVGPVAVSPSIRFVSRRFTTFENVNALSLPPTATAGLSARTSFPIANSRATVTASLRNLFDAAESSIPGYPLPGRSFTLRLEWTPGRDETATP